MWDKGVWQTGKAGGFRLQNSCLVDLNAASQATCVDIHLGCWVLVGVGATACSPVCMHV